MKTKKSKLNDLIQKTKLSGYEWRVRNVLSAYSDCNGLEDSDGIRRNLDFFCGDPFKIGELEKIMSVAVPTGYNAFDAKGLGAIISAAFGDKCHVFIARESSVCLYIKPSQNVWFGSGRECDLLNPKLNCDEISFDETKGMFRLWWD